MKRNFKGETFLQNLRLTLYIAFAVKTNAGRIAMEFDEINDLIDEVFAENDPTFRKSVDRLIEMAKQRVENNHA